MSTYWNKQTTIKNAIAPLSPIALSDVLFPTTVQESRNNLKRFYGCVDGKLQVFLERNDLNNRPIELPAGKRFGSQWEYECSRESHMALPHPAVEQIMVADDSLFISVDPEHMSNLWDLCEITKSGPSNEAHYPTFTINLILGRETPIVENLFDSQTYIDDLMLECKERFGRQYSDEGWICDPSCYRLFANDDSTLKQYGGFYLYSVEKMFAYRWREMTGLDTRYLHWLLLGPFAPYQYNWSNKIIAA